jgi:hypothetical protein
MIHKAKIWIQRERKESAKNREEIVRGKVSS